MTLRTWSTYRVAVAALLIVLVAPTVASGLAQFGGGDGGDLSGAANVTFVGVQGGFGPADDGRVVAINTDTRDLIWEFSRGGPGEDVLYYDVDPLSRRELLVVEQVTGGEAAVLHVNWRTGEVLREVSVPSDTHDVDYLGDGRYVVADKYNHRAYVYDRDSEAIVWEYAFADHFAAYPEAGEGPASEPSGAGGYTHLNDVDVVAGGEAVLLSPRNFDRVVLVDRSTKDTRFVLGAEDETDILHEQHNPTLLSMEPPTVLVADSENDRVVEYRQRPNGTWALAWAYRGDLHWPRDADRLPNGNTLIVDTYGQRVVEITPAGDVVWARQVAKMPYDVERLKYGDEPQGPPSATDELRRPATGGGVSVARDLYAQALWVLPAWIDFWAFYALVGAVLVGASWLVGELALARR